MSGTGVEMMAVCGVCESLLWWDEDTQEWFCAPCEDVEAELAELDKAKV